MKRLVLLLVVPLAVACGWATSPLAVDEEGKSPAPSPKATKKGFASWLFEAERHYTQGDFKQAEPSFNEALKASRNETPDSASLARVHFFLANIHLQNGKGQLANRHYQKSLSLKGDSPTTYAYYAHAKLRGGEFEVAEALYTKSLELAENYWVCYEGLGHALFHQGKLLKSADMFERVLVANPDHPKRVVLGLLVKRLRQQHEERLRKEEEERQKRLAEEAKKKEIDKKKLRLGKSAKPKSEESIKDVEPDLDIIDD